MMCATPRLHATNPQRRHDSRYYWRTSGERGCQPYLAMAREGLGSAMCNGSATVKQSTTPQRLVVGCSRKLSNTVRNQRERNNTQAYARVCVSLEGLAADEQSERAREATAAAKSKRERQEGGGEAKEQPRARGGAERTTETREPLLAPAKNTPRKMGPKSNPRLQRTLSCLVYRSNPCGRA